MASSPMLRDFAHAPDIYLVRDIFFEFQLEADETLEGPMTIIWFKVLSPDSFAWKVALGSRIYLIYAEDYIKSLDYVKRQMRELSGGTELEFKKVHDAQHFAKASPVRHATLYKRPVRANEMMQYAATSGYDFVFLARSIEAYEDAFFTRKT